jgi:hypothetical protein
MKPEELTPHLGKISLAVGAVRSRDLQMFAVFNDELSREKHPHTRLFQRYQGNLGQVDLNWTASSLSVCGVPKHQFIAISEEGFVLVHGSGESIEEPEVDTALAQDEGPENRGPLREVRGIAGGKAYAVGTARQAYRRDAPGRWVRIDQSAQGGTEKIWEKSFNSIDGFSETDIYAVGWDGEIWSYDGAAWSQIASPTNVALYRVRCAADGNVYACGQAGVLLRGRDRSWEVVDHRATEEDFWWLEYFNGKLYVCSMNSLYELDGDDLRTTDFGECAPPATCYCLSAADGLLWSVGAKNIVEYDGKQWKTVIG